MKTDGFKKFKEVFPGIELDDDINEYFDDVEVTRVEMVSSTTTIYVRIQSKHLIARPNIKKAEEALRLFVFGDEAGNVKIEDRYLLSGQYNLKNLMHIYGDSIMDERRDTSAIEHALVKMSDIKCKDNLITIQMIEGKLSRERKADIEIFFNHLFATKFGMNINTSVKLVKRIEEEEEPEIKPFIKEIDDEELASLEESSGSGEKTGFFQKIRNFYNKERGK